MTGGADEEVLHLTTLWGYVRRKGWEPLYMGNDASLPQWRAAVPPQHGLFTFLSHPQEHYNACSSTSLQPQSLAPMNCQACFSKL